jgi:hypothetical protein
MEIVEARITDNIIYRLPFTVYDLYELNDLNDLKELPLTAQWIAVIDKSKFLI